MLEIDTFMLLQILILSTVLGKAFVFVTIFTKKLYVLIKNYLFTLN